MSGIGTGGIHVHGGGTHRNWRGLDAKQIVDRLGQSANLQTALDAGDSSSYTSGQSWLDLSGNGQDFFLGTTSGSEASDPTFNGTAGLLSPLEYFGHDGGDFFTYDTTNETWMENIHKDNAAFTLYFVFMMGVELTNQALAGTCTFGASSSGFMMNITSGSNSPNLIVRDGAGGGALSITPTGVSVSAGVWSICGISVDEANDLAQWFTSRGGLDPDPAAYTSPSSSAADQTLSIGSRGGSVTPMTDGSRFALFLGFSRALNGMEMHRLGRALRRRWMI